MTRSVDIIYFDAGSGHRSAAIGLASALRSRHGIDARPVDLVDVVRGHPGLHRWTVRGVNYFNWWLRREGVWDLKGTINLALLTHDLVKARGEPLIAQFWGDRRPDAVVSVTPMYNPLLARAFHRVRPKSPYLIVPVDFEEGKKRYWFDSKADATYLLTGDRQRQQARNAGVPDDRLVQLSGMVIDPIFYSEPPTGRAERLLEMGLDPDRPTALVSFGGQGSVLVEKCVRGLAGVGRPLNVIALCGRAEGLRDRVQAIVSPHRIAALGFGKDPPVVHHHLADVVIGKPGSMTITESIVTGTPVLPIRSRGMWVVQRGNEQWVERERVGHVIPRPDQLPEFVDRVLDDPAYAERARAARHEAIWEAVDHIAQAVGVGVDVPTTPSALPG